MITASTQKINIILSQLEQRVTKLSQKEATKNPSPVCESPQCVGCPSLLNLVKTNQDLWMAVIDNDTVSNSIARRGYWEKETTNFFLKNIRQGDVIIELGANIGYYTNLLAKLVGTTGTIHAYEANTEVSELAKLSLSMNNLSSIVSMHEYAVSNVSGFLNFTYTPRSYAAKGRVNIGTSHLDIGSFNQKAGRKLVKTVTLDEDLPDLPNVDWIRMDIQ